MTNQRGFTLPEPLISTAIMLTVIASATRAFKDALSIGAGGSLIADANQSLRAASNLMIR